jgi:uncharacterized protein YdcH (DUF465 family)
MTLTRLQKIGLVFFVFTLVPAYLIANWRHSAALETLDAAYAREADLHKSTDKLISNCEHNDSPYDANQQICIQGQRLHAQTSEAMQTLVQQKSNNDSQWHTNFWLSVVVFNLIAWAIYKGKRALRE